MPIQFPSNPATNQTYVYNGITWTWTGRNWTKSAAGGGAATVTVSNSAPVSATTGALWIDEDAGDLNAYVGNAWITLSGGGGGVGNATVDLTQVTTNIFTQGTITSNIPFYMSSTTITANFTIPEGYNAQTPGPITVANNVVVTVPNGSTWTVV